MKRTVLLWVVPFLLVAAAAWTYASSGGHVETDNAYLQQDRVDVAPQVSGNVTAVRVAENAQVEAGQPVLTLDDAVAAAESRLASARVEVAALKASYREKLGQAAVARRAAELSTRELERQKQLAERRLIPASELDAVERSTDISVGAVGVLQLQIEQTVARLGGDPAIAPERLPAVRAAQAELERARLDLARTIVRAPQKGVVSHLPKVGSRAEAGRPAFAIVVNAAPWVEANFKETDLEWVRPGQPALVKVDTYREHTWRGRVESISQATGSIFAVLPAQNASGNWVKVVQRIPVRIALEPGRDDPPLRSGMSATVRVDTGPHSRLDRWLAALRR
jgi:membrane fusion protein (multidrug efflux system)